MDFVFHTQKKNEDKFTFKKLNLCALSSQQNPGTRGVYPSRSSWLCPHIPPPELMSLHPQSARSLINPKPTPTSVPLLQSVSSINWWLTTGKPTCRSVCESLQRHWDDGTAACSDWGRSSCWWLVNNCRLTRHGTSFKHNMCVNKNTRLVCMHPAECSVNVKPNIQLFL